jgi:hypothetical protein
LGKNGSQAEGKIYAQTLPNQSVQEIPELKIEEYDS